MSSHDQDALNLNTLLNNYYTENVQMNRKNTEKSSSIVIPIVERILKHISKLDPRFSSVPAYTGSYYQGLKVKRADEFDMNVPLCKAGPLYWSTTSHQHFYGFNDGTNPTDSSRTCPQDRKVVRSNIPLPSPPTGCVFTSFGSNSPYSMWINANDMIMDGDIIPYLVRKNFKDLLTEALNSKELSDIRDYVGQSRWVHGPALTINIKYPNHYLVNVDFAPIIEAKLEIPSSIKWPRPNKQWPSREKIEKIKSLGINEVAKKDFYWVLSYAQMEKELIKEIDKDGGCRKRCHRITKKLLQDFWCPASKPVISSYLLKNILFWECEDFPYTHQWTSDMQAERVLSLTKRLLKAVIEVHLPVYFNPDVNLLLGKGGEDLDLAKSRVAMFLNRPGDYLKKN